jgi:hypothetical protein
MGEMRNAYNISVRENTTRKTGVGGRIILEWILGKLCGRVWNGFVWLRIRING